MRKLRLIYIDTDNMILCKGAVAACEGQKLLIPINMRDGSLVCIGKGIDEIISHIGPTVEIAQRITPIYTFKAAD